MAQSWIGAPYCHGGADAGRTDQMMSLQRRRRSLGPAGNICGCCFYFSTETKAALSGWSPWKHGGGWQHDVWLLPHTLPWPGGYGLEEGCG